MIALIDETCQEAEDAFVFDGGRRWPNEHSPISERPMLMRVVESGEPFVIDDVPGEAIPRGQGSRFGDHDNKVLTRSILAVPLTVDGRAIGMMTAQHYQPHMYTAEHVQAMVILANQVAIVIDHARLVESFQLRVAALNAAANTIVITDRLGQVEWANPALTGLTGYSLEEVRGKNVGRLLKSGQHSEGFYKNLWTTILEGRPWQGQVTNRKKNGELYTEEMTITPVQDAQGESRHFIAIKQDITNRQRAEQALRESEEKYRTVVEQAEDGVAIVQEGVIQFANPRLAEIRGEEIHNLLGKSILEFIDEADRARIKETYASRLASEDVLFPYEVTLLRRDGARIDAEMSAASITYLGNPAELVIVRDISERKRTDQMLQRRLKEMVALNDVSAAGVRATNVDELIHTVTGIIRDSLYPEACGVLIVHEEDATWTAHPSYAGMRAEEASRSCPLTEGIAGMVIRAGKAVRDSSISGGSEICVPMRVNGKVYGCLDVRSSAEGEFSDHDERLVTTLADSLSIAIEKIQLLKQEQQRRAEAAAITEVGRDISASLELDTVLQRIVRYAQELLHGETSAVYLADAKQESLRAVAAIGFEAEEIKNDPIKVGQGILGNIAAHWSGEIVNDVMADSRTLTVQGTEINPLEHIMGVPILNKGSLIGLIAVWRTGINLNFKNHGTGFPEQPGPAGGNGDRECAPVRGDTETPAGNGRHGAGQHLAQPHAGTGAAAGGDPAGGDPFHSRCGAGLHSPGGR